MQWKPQGPESLLSTSSKLRLKAGKQAGGREMKSHRDGISASHEHHRIAQKIKAAEDQHPGTHQCNNMLINQSFF